MHTRICDGNCTGRITDFHVGQSVLYLPIADANASTLSASDEPFSWRHHMLQQGYVKAIEEQELLVEFSHMVENPNYRVPSDYEEGEEFDPGQEPVYREDFILCLKPCQLEPTPQGTQVITRTFYVNGIPRHEYKFKPAWDANQFYDENGEPLPEKYRVNRYFGSENWPILSRHIRKP